MAESILLQRTCNTVENTSIPSINTFKFGQYKGKTYAEIYKKDPAYFRWCYYKAKDNPSKNSIYIKEMDNIMKNSGCISYGEKKGFIFCRSCGSMHNIK